jgi:hypothetical protein
MIFCSGSSKREGANTGRRCSRSASSASLVEFLADRTAAKVAIASTSVPPAVASEDMVAQSVARGSIAHGVCHR